MHITGLIVSKHSEPSDVAASLAPDNGDFIRVHVRDGNVVAEIEGESLRTVIATVDDYLMNLQVSEKLIKR